MQLDLRQDGVRSHGCLAYGMAGLLVAAAGCAVWGFAIDDLSLQIFAGVLAAPGIGLAVMLVSTYPKAMTRQGVEVSDDGLAMVQDPKLWLPGRELRLTWQQLHSVVVHTPDAPVVSYVDIYLHRTPPTRQVPHFARLVPAHRRPPGGGAASDRPRLRIRLTPGRDYDLIRPIREVRPELFAVDRAEPVRPPAPNALAASPAARPQWVSLRGRGLPGLLAILAIAILSDALLVTLAVAGDPQLGTGQVEELAPLGCVGLVAVVATVVAIQLAPRRLARQGVAVDASGITLVQEPKWWFAGVTAYIAWPRVRLIRDDRRPDPDPLRMFWHYRAIDIMLAEPDLLPQVPTWVERAPREANLPPTSRYSPLTRITILRRRQRVLDALRAARPDLCETVNG